ncbi:hypothetical protein DNTS_011666 [Danionella cerebrum]|uniref:Myb-binding protein 1A n=1 Tax=Danionella cerebrum TaxID=2873325 RepID=A0A553P157_9TELE|nr:hypothetical protein DNTS_011666 [Danionella translucida]
MLRDFYFLNGGSNLARIPFPTCVRSRVGLSLSLMVAVAVMETDMGEVEEVPVRPKINDAKGILKQNRQFLDYFWNIAKPERNIRLEAIEGLIEHLKQGHKADELKYSLKRLVDGLCHTREDARSGYSVALAQVLSVFEEISLKSTLDSIREKHKLQTADKKNIRNVAFGNFFGVLALSQSTRLHKEPQVMLECVQLLQSLAQYREHLRDLPRKTMLQILAETSESAFEELLLGTLHSELSSALASPDRLELLLVALQRFPSIFKPKKLKKLLGSTTVITKESMPKLVGVLKSAARSVKMESVLPPVALDLLQVSLREGNFEMFWTEAIIKGIMADAPGPTHYLAFRLLGESLPLLSISQLEFVLSGDVMRHFGEHMLSAQLPDRFKFSPEMDKYVKEFLKVCEDEEKHLAVVQGFSQLTNQGNPVIPTFWKPLDHMRPLAVQRYIQWLMEAFCRPQLKKCLDFSTRRQKGTQEAGAESVSAVARFRKWIIQRLIFIVENDQIQKQEDLVMSVARFILLHAFFVVKKPSPEIPETTQALATPIDPQTQVAVSSGFYSLLQGLNSKPLLDGSTEPEIQTTRRITGVTADGNLWIYSLVRFADMLLNQSKHVQSIQSFSPEQMQGWDSVLESVDALRKKAKKSPSPEHTAFQYLFLLIGIQMFKSPEESLDFLNDLRTCMEKAQAKKLKKKKKKKAVDASSEEEPHWVEVVVEILLALLSQPSRLTRSDESGVVVTDEKKKKTKEEKDDDDDDDEVEGDDDKGDGEKEEGSSDSSDEEEEEEEDEAMDDGGEVDQKFRMDLMKVLQGQNALATEEDGSDEEELDDAAMMKLDGSLASLFLEQKKKIQAKKDEKSRLNKEKVLVRDFKVKVLDLVEVFIQKQGSSALVLAMVEPLLSIIQNTMSSESNQHEQDFLRRAADIFSSRLCRGKYYCREVEGREAELHEMLERLIGRAQKLTDSSVALYFFSAALYVLKVLRGVVNEQELSFMGKVEVERVTMCFQNALTSFMSRRQSPLTGAMFIDLFNRFPGQACLIVLKALHCKDVKKLMSDDGINDLHQKVVNQLSKSLENVEYKNKSVHEKASKALELCHYLVKTVKTQKLQVDLKPLENALLSMNAEGSLQKHGQLENLYWVVMKFFGIMKPKMRKVKKVVAVADETEETMKKKKKEKGFLPETKKRKARQTPTPLEGNEPKSMQTTDEVTSEEVKKKKKKNKKRKKQEGAGEETQDQPSPKKAKVQQQQKNKKKGGVKKKGGD